MAKKVKANNIAKELGDIFNKYTDDVVEAICDHTIGVAETGKTQLRMALMPEASKSGSAKPMTRRQWKNYAKSWYVKQEGGVDSGFIHCSIHNKKHYQLTHLLEYGHATRNGTRTREFRHIEPVEVYCTDRLEKDIPKIIEKGGKL